MREATRRARAAATRAAAMRAAALAAGTAGVALVAALVAVGGSVAVLEAQATEEFRWNGELQAGRTLEVSARNGGIRAVPATGRQVEITATKRTERGGRAELAEVEVRVLEHAGGITVCAVYPGASGGGADRCPTEHRGKRGSTDVSVDFEVRVPDGVRFHAQTVNGGIDARDLNGDVALRTVNGGIEVSTAGTATAETVNGSIRASIGRLGAEAEGGLSFKTVNGPVQVTLPANAGARVRLETVNGALESDFPLTIAAGSRLGTRRGGPSKLEGTIGDGGPSLELRTVNGTIELRRRG